MMEGMGTRIGRTAMDHTVITAARFMGRMAMVVFIPIITAAGFRRRRLSLRRGLLSLRDSTKAVELLRPSRVQDRLYAGCLLDGEVNMQPVPLLGLCQL